MRAKHPCYRGNMTPSALQIHSAVKAHYLSNYLVTPRTECRAACCPSVRLSVTWRELSVKTTEQVYMETRERNDRLRSSKVTDFMENVHTTIPMINGNFGPNLVALFQRYCKFSAENNQVTLFLAKFWAGLPILGKMRRLIEQYSRLQSILCMIQ